MMDAVELETYLTINLAALTMIILFGVYVILKEGDSFK